MGASGETAARALQLFCENSGTTKAASQQVAHRQEAPSCPDPLEEPQRSAWCWGQRAKPVHVGSSPSVTGLALSSG